MLTETEFDNTINQTIVAAANESWAEYREGLNELAGYWKTMQHHDPATDYKQSWIEICQFIEQAAVNITGDELLRTKIQLELREAFRARIIH